MDWLEIIASNIQLVGNWISMGFNRITNVLTSISNVFTTIYDFLSAVVYAIGTLLSGIWDFTKEILQGEVFTRVAITFGQLGDYIGGPAVVLLASMFVFVIIRIGIAFVFKILRLNLDYNTLQKRTDKANKHKK